MNVKRSNCVLYQIELNVSFDQQSSHQVVPKPHQQHLKDSQVNYREYLFKHLNYLLYFDIFFVFHETIYLNK